MWTKGKIWLPLALALTLMLAASQLCWGQRHIPDPDAAAKIKAATQSITLHARIGYDLDHGGYYIKNNPKYNFGTKEILNQNFEVLKKLAKRGKTVTIQGRVDPLNFMATHVFIETIDGRKYQGRHAPMVKRP